MIPSLLPRLLRGESLTEEEAQAVIGHVMHGEASEAQIAGLLVALRAKGESVAEIVGAARAMRAHAVAVAPRRTDLVDTVRHRRRRAADVQRVDDRRARRSRRPEPASRSTATARVSSASGSADVLEALGVRLDLPAARVAECIDEVGFGFLFAPAHHPAMRHAGPVRSSLGVRTIFNVLGPLTNPVGARRQLVGVFDEALVAADRRDPARARQRAGAGRARLRRARRALARRPEHLRRRDARRRDRRHDRPGRARTGALADRGSRRRRRGDQRPARCARCSTASAARAAMPWR